MFMHFRSFRLQPPHAPPVSGNARCSGRAWPPTRLVGLSAVLRTSFSASSLVSRIRPYRVRVGTLGWLPVLRTIRSLPVALHALSPRRSYFQLSDGQLRQEGTSTLLCTLTFKRTSGISSECRTFPPVLNRSLIFSKKLPINSFHIPPRTGSELRYPHETLV